MANLISLGQVFDKTIEHYRKHFGEFMTITAWMGVAAIPAVLAKVIRVFMSLGEVTPLMIVSMLLTFASAIALAVVGSLVVLTLLFTIRDQAEGKSGNITSRFAEAKKAFWPYVLTNALFALVILATVIVPIIGLGLAMAGSAALLNNGLVSAVGMACILIGCPVALVLIIKFSIEYGFGPYAAVLDKKPVTAALPHAKSLVRGRFFDVLIRYVPPKFLFTLVGYLARLVAILAISFLVALILGSSALGSGFASALYFLIEIAITAVLMPLLTLTDYYIYDSLRNSR